MMSKKEEEKDLGRRSPCLAQAEVGVHGDVAQHGEVGRTLVHHLAVVWRKARTKTIIIIIFF